MVSLHSNPLKIIHLQILLSPFPWIQFKWSLQNSHKIVYFSLLSNATKLNIKNSSNYEKFDNIKKKKEDILGNKFKHLQVNELLKQFIKN